MASKIVELARSGDIVINKKYGMTRAEFLRDHAEPGIPVVIGDATEAWPARRTFTADFFRARFGDRALQVGERRFTMRECLDLLEHSTLESPGPYPCNFMLQDYFPELVADVQPRFAYALPDRVASPLLPKRLLGGASTLEVFFGGPGGQFPYLHYDYMGLHAFINQLVGEKEFTAIPPQQTEWVYPDPQNKWKSLIENHHAPDLARYPLFAKTTKVSFVIGPGETLFIPNGWWHTARSLSFTISVAFDLLGASNWPRFRNEVREMMQNSRPAKRVLMDSYLGVLGPVLAAGEALGLAR